MYISHVYRYMVYIYTFITMYQPLNIYIYIYPINNMNIIYIYNYVLNVLKVYGPQDSGTSCMRVDLGPVVMVLVCRILFQ